MRLLFDIKFHDLYTHEGLKKLHLQFLQYLKDVNNPLYSYLQEINAQSLNSTTILQLAPVIQSFIIDLFDISYNTDQTKDAFYTSLLIQKCNRSFIQRVIAKQKDPPEILLKTATDKLSSLIKDINDISLAKHILQWHNNATDHEEELYIATQYIKHQILLQNPSPLFFIPQKTDPFSLIKIKSHNDHNYTNITSNSIHPRYGFNLTDTGISNDQALIQSKYCIFCHERNKDSCSKGLLDKNNTPKISQLQNSLHGCPLKEKISEMHLMKSQNLHIAALAIICLDNPMCAGTGHRICNDCMQSCIYQKQEPVNTPAVETNILDNVLELPYGFEIYSLLTRWNPLNIQQPFTLDNTNYKILVVGMGPAGYTLSHYLLQSGHCVVGIDGIKIEPEDPELVGKNFQPIKSIANQLYESLENRNIYGFGGVSEYGITSRWNKNYLRVIRIILERHPNFQLHGSVRFGSNISYNDALSTLQFDHISLATGSGQPNIPVIPNITSKGVRTASDFLMSLQLTAAYQHNKISNLQIRLPIVIIGGGLTAIDTATEALAYYPRQLEKFYKNFQDLLKHRTHDEILSCMSEEDKVIALEFLEHAEMIRNNPDHTLSFIQHWGGVKIIYRKEFTSSPAYRINPHELESALKEGIEFLPNIQPLSINKNIFNAVESLEIINTKTNKNLSLPAHTILVATGTKPNTHLAKEYPEYLSRKSDYFFTLLDNEPNNIHSSFAVHKNKNNQYITVFGDVHPDYHGSVVKAMASAKTGHKYVSSVLRQRIPSCSDTFFKDIRSQLESYITNITYLTKNVIEITILSPLAAKNFQPGQFYKLQNYISHSPTIEGYSMSTEALALTGSDVDREKGLVSLIVLTSGTSSHMCRVLKVGQPISLMGPTGSPTILPHNKNIMLIGGGLGNAVLYPIAKSLRENNCKILYFAGYKHKEDLFKQSHIEQCSDTVVWACDSHDIITSRRIQDHAFQGNIINAILQYSYISSSELPISSIDHIITIGSDKMMEATHNIRSKIPLPPHHTMIASINSSMQCMMKEICAQCIQKHINPKTGEESIIYSCANQDQDTNFVDFFMLNNRLKTNSLLEKISLLWLQSQLSLINKS